MAVAEVNDDNEEGEEGELEERNNNDKWKKVIRYARGKIDEWGVGFTWSASGFTFCKQKVKFIEVKVYKAKD